MRVLALLLALASAPVQAQLRLGGIAELAAAFELRDGQAQKTELSLLPTLEWRGPVDLTAIARLRADAYDRLEPGVPEQDAVAPGSRRALGERVEAELRELYVDVYRGASYLRLGKQQIVWGQADGLKVLDRINPQRFREFILADFDDSRIPLWALKFERPLGRHLQLQLVYLPDQSYHELPSAGASFAITSPELVPQAGTPPVSLVTQRPDRRFADADAGAQLAGRLAGWDLTLNYLYHYDDSPVLRLRRVPDGVAAELGYARTHTVGASAANAFGDFTLRLESGYATERHFPAAAPAPGRATVAAGELSYLVGVDWQGLTDTLISAQLLQARAALQGAARGAVETDITLLIERSWFNRLLRLRTLAIHDLDRGDGLLSPALHYTLGTDLVLGLELDVFYGSSRGRFGQFDARDRLVLLATHGF